MSSSEPVVEHTTAMALEEKGHLQKSLRRFDMLFFTVCALVGLDTLGQVSGFGAPDVHLARHPRGVVRAARTRSSWPSSAPTFTQEGGPYEWMKMCWGRLGGRHRRRCSTGSRTRSGSAARWPSSRPTRGARTSIRSDRASRSATSRFKMVFIWISIGVAIASLRRGKWIPNVGAIVRVGVLGVLLDHRA